MSNPFKPKLNTSAPAAPPPLPSDKAPERLLGSEKNRKGDRRRRGKEALRIDLETGGVPRTKTGLNVPVG